MAYQSEQLQHETEQTRAQLAETLRELRNRITPGQVMDELLEYTRQSAVGDFARNLGNQVRQEPLPVGLIGIGIAWLLWSTARGSRPSAYGRASGWSRSSDHGSVLVADTTEGARLTSNRSRHNGSGIASSATEMTGEHASQTDSGHEASSHAAHRLVGGIRDAASTVYERTSEAADRVAGSLVSGNSAGAMVRSGRGMTEFLRDHPLVLAGFGIALGAAFGAALPRSETESRIMGEASDALKQRVRDVAAEQYNKAKHALDAGIEPVAREAELAPTEDATRPTTEALGIAPVAPS